MAGKKAKKKQKPVHKKSKKPARQEKKQAVQQEMKLPLVLPPMEKEAVEDEAKPKDEFFDEEALKEFSVMDDEEGQDEDSPDAGESEPAWDDEEF
ncbi:MAG: hypothetical protein QXM31_01175 [Candidatus Woesearchaeota archaeon]